MNTSKTCLSIIDKNKLNRIVAACCEYYELSEEDLLTLKSRDVSNVRHYVYYIISVNLTISNPAIAELFGKGKNTKNVIRFGIEKITAHKNIYSDVQRNLRKIAELANKVNDSDLITY